jgi:hypothetical protein
MLNDGERIDVSPERGHEPPSGRFQIDDSAGAVVIRPKMPRVDIEVAGRSGRRCCSSSSRAIDASSWT